MDRSGPVGDLVVAVARAVVVPLQTATSGTNGTNTSNGSTNGTAVPNAPQGIERGTERAVGFFQRLWPDGLPVPPTWLLQLVLAIGILVVAWYGSKVVIRLLTRRVARRFRRPSVVQTVLGSIRSAIMLIAAFVAAYASGLVQPGDILISATVLTAATGLVLAPIIGSVVNGLLILADQPYEVGDMIEFVDSADSTQSGEIGFIEDITLRYTKVFTLDNTFIVVPNSSMRDQDVVNYSAEDPRTRLSLDVLVTYEGDLREARDLVERAAREVDIVVSGGPDIRIGSARYPAAPTCYINEFADSGVLLTLRYWAREPYALLTVRSRVQENVWSALADANVEMAYPHTHVFFDETTGELPLSVGNADRTLGNGTDRTDTTDRRGDPREAADGGARERSRGRYPPVADPRDLPDGDSKSDRS